MNDAARKLIDEHRRALENFAKSGGTDTVECIAKAIWESSENGGVVYLCGNGGSAADAQHVSGELVGRFKRIRKPLAAIALSTDTSVITCIANDFSYDDIFDRQAQAIIKHGDVFWGFLPVEIHKMLLMD